MDTIPKVFVLQHPVRRGTPLDITDAARYGELQIPIFPPRYNTLLEAEDAVVKLEKYLVGYTEDDFLIAIGDPILIGIAMAISARNSESGIVKVLKWNRSIDNQGRRNMTSGNYVPTTVKLDVQ